MPSRVWLRKLFNKYYNLDIRKKFIIIMFIPLIVVMIVSGTAIKMVYESTLERNFMESNLKTLQLIANDIEDETQKVEDVAKSVCSNEDIFNLSDKKFRKFYEDKGGKQTITLNMQKLFADIICKDTKIEYMGILTDLGDWIYSSRNTSVREPYGVKLAQEDYSNDINSCKSPEVLSLKKENSDFLAYILPIYGLSEYKEVGKLFCLFTSTYIKESISKHDTDFQQYEEDIDYAIYDNRGESIFCSKADSVYNLSLFTGMGSRKMGYYHAKLNGQKSVVFFKHTDKYKAIIIKVVPLDHIVRNANKVSKIIILIVLLSVVFVIGMFYLTFSNFSKKINSLINTMKEVSSGNLNKRFPEVYHDEIGTIGKYLNKMIGDIETLIKDMNEVEIRNKEAQLNVLESQINPHFLYNTLDSIRMMALINKDMQAADMIFKLSNIFRYSIKKGSTFVTIENEIQHMKDYLDIQRFRYSNRFNINLDIEEQILSYYTIKLILQPIVENAIYHGLELKKGKGNLNVRGFLKDDEIIFIIEDNGVGINFDQLKLIRENLSIKSDKQESRSIGLKNVYDRIKNYFGDKYGLVIESVEGECTRITINLPVIRNL